MKKFLAILFVLCIQLPVFSASYIDKQFKEAKKNNKYNSVQKYKRDFNFVDNYIKFSAQDLKDPKLIKLSDFTPVDEKLYKQKLADDEAVYNKQIKPLINKKMNSINVEPAAIDFYKVYRISERLIRANNLEYVNWRIAIRKSEDINAYSTQNNYIAINTALYDSLYTNEDALAFVIAHEMSHLILGHSQRSLEIRKKLSLMVSREILANGVYPLPVLYQVKRAFDEYKMMEFMADAEALSLVIRAGYSPSKALDALNFLDILPNIRMLLQTHPVGAERLASANENIYFADINAPEEGKANIYNSEVLNCKKSSDRVSIVIEKSEKIKKYYEVETPVKKMTRLAYMSYLKGDMKNAEKYFSKLSDLSDDYIPYLYLSYVNERLYKQTKNDKYLKRAGKNALKAQELNPNDENVKKQISDIETI